MSLDGESAAARIVLTVGGSSGQHTVIGSFSKLKTTRTAKVSRFWWLTVTLSISAASTQ
jgi:hypothetical protein